jgi:hypothetical protein
MKKLAANDIAGETGLEHRPVTDGQRVTGIYRRSIMLASGRYAMLDDGMGFSLVPWKPVIEQRLGVQIAVVVRTGSVSWEVGRQRAPSRRSSVREELHHSEDREDAGRMFGTHLHAADLERVEPDPSVAEVDPCRAFQMPCANFPPPSTSAPTRR